MKKIFITLILLSIFIVRSHAQSGSILMAEDFSNNKNNWPTYIGDKVTYLVYNGKYIFSTNDTNLSYSVYMPVTLDMQKDFSISVVSTHTGGTQNAGYGIEFGAIDGNNYYSFDISANGYYRINKNTATGYTDIVKWTTTTIVKTGDYVDNTIQLSKSGGNWVVGVNGQTVATVPALPFLGNKIGFNQSNIQRIEYDDIKVVQ
jgi:hypothetical protein